MPNRGTFTMRRLFPGIDDNDLAKLNASSNVVMLRKGKNLFVSGDSPRSIYAVANGCLKIVRENAEGEAIIVRIVKSGEILGLHELFTESNYCRTAIALRDSEIFVIETKEVLDLVSRVPQVGVQFVKKLCFEIGSIEQRLEASMFKTARSRVTSVLYNLYNSFAEAGANSFEPPLSRRDIAELSDVAPETVSRVLADLKQNGIIETQGALFRITDANAFASESEL